MALWRDPLDELIDDLDRVITPALGRTDRELQISLIGCHRFVARFSGAASEDAL
jgi:hypothetical protein